MHDSQPENVKPLEKASLASHHFCREFGSLRGLLYFCEPGQAGYEQQCSTTGPQMPSQTLDKSIHRLPAALAPVQGIVYPLTRPFLP